MRWSDLRRGPVPALLAGLVLRTFFVLHHPRFTGDTLVYGDLAHNLLAHHIYGLTEDHVRATLIRLPGYPLFLALCFLLFGTANYLAVIWVQVGVDLAACLLLASVARRAFGQRAGRAALWLSVLCPFTANYPAAALTETLSIFCVVLGVWALARWIDVARAGGSAFGWAGVIGCALSGAVLLRPDGVLLAGAVVPGMVWVAWGGRGQGQGQQQQQIPFGNDKLEQQQQQQGQGQGQTQIPYGNDKPEGQGQSRRRTALLGTVIAVLMMGGCLGGWAARNWRVYHVFQPLAPKYANDPGESEPLGFARWYRTWAIGFDSSVEVYWRYDGDPLSLNDLPARAFDSAQQRAKTAAIYAQYNAVTSSTPELEAEFNRLAEARIRDHPVRYYVVLPLAKLADMWLRPRTELMKLPLDWWNVRAHPRRSAFQIGYGGLNLALLALGGAGWVGWWRRGWGGYGAVAFACAGWVVLRSALLLTIDNSEPRYTLECLPVILLLAAVMFAEARSSEGRDAKMGRARDDVAAAASIGYVCKVEVGRRDQ